MAMTPVDLLIVGAGELVTMAGGPRRGDRMKDAGVIPGGALAARDGRIVAVGPADEVLAAVETGPGTQVIDARGRAVIPGFVDPHTHLCFAGDRAEEFALRLGGATYQELAARGGGILKTVRATRAASQAELVELGLTRLDQLALNGTTTVEVKSGYGLNTGGRAEAAPGDPRDGPPPSADRRADLHGRARGAAGVPQPPGGLRRPAGGGDAARGGRGAGPGAVRRRLHRAGGLLGGGVPPHPGEGESAGVRREGACRRALGPGRGRAGGGARGHQRRAPAPHHGRGAGPAGGGGDRGGRACPAPRSA